MATSRSDKSRQVGVTSGDKSGATSATSGVVRRSHSKNEPAAAMPWRGGGKTRRARQTGSLMRPSRTTQSSRTRLRAGASGRFLVVVSDIYSSASCGKVVYSPQIAPKNCFQSRHPTARRICFRPFSPTHRRPDPWTSTTSSAATSAAQIWLRFHRQRWRQGSSG